MHSDGLMASDVVERDVTECECEWRGGMFVANAW